MTSKELLYVEDALGHARYLETCCKATAIQLNNAELSAYADQLAKEHAECFAKLYALLG